MSAGEVSDFDARLMPAFGGKPEQGADFIEGKSEFPCAPDKGQSATLRLAVKPAPAGSARRVRHHNDTLVVTDGLDVCPRAPGEFANRDHGASIGKSGGAHRKLDLDPVAATGCRNAHMSSQADDQIRLAGSEPKARNLDLSERLLAGGGVLGALVASSCCLVPLPFFRLGLGGAWLGSLTRLAPYHPHFLALPALS